MRWTPEIEAGRWLVERLDDPWRGTIHDVVPRGFPAYARVLHPAARARGDEREPASWATAATAFGTRIHPLAQWHALVAPGPFDDGGPRDLDGWHYEQPPVGDLTPEALAAAAQHLLAHTATPDSGHLALWEGWGGLLGASGPTASRAFFQSGGDAIGHHNAMLGAAVPERFRSPFAQHRWHPGILPDDVSRGPRLTLPGRGHVLFTAGVRELVSPSWILDAPWRDREAEEHGFAPSAQSPSLLWPADRAWVLVTDVDWDSTVIGGPAALVAALCADPRLEAYSIAADTALTDDADTLNG